MKTCARCGHEEKFHGKECFKTLHTQDGEDFWCECPGFVEATTEGR